MMRHWNRRRFLQISGIGLILALTARTAQAGMFFLKKFLSLPPRKTLPITPNSDFYVYDIGRFSKMIQDLDYSDWKLYLTGAVSQPLSLSYDQLKKRPYREAAVTIECVENSVGGTSIGNAIWRGFLLSELLKEAGVESETRKVVFKAADGYTDSVTVTQALEGEILLAYEMNGVPLPRQHGYPLRAVVPGIYGMKNVKWIMDIEVTQEDYKCYWQQRGWSDKAKVLIMSRIDAPGSYQELAGPQHEIRGIAFAGSRGIKKVEVSTNGGRAWATAQIDPPLSSDTWALWHYRWKVSGTGIHRILVRATDGKGRLQDSEDSPAFPDGTTGLHAVVVDVVDQV